jgi:adenosine deaminase
MKNILELRRQALGICLHYYKVGTIDKDLYNENLKYINVAKTTDELEYIINELNKRMFEDIWEQL